MFEALLEIVLAVWAHIQVLGQTLIEYLSASAESAFNSISRFKPTQDVVLWIQVVVGIMTIVWIIFQFAWLRRLNEARLERHLESTISSERDELADERTATLAELDRVVKRRGLRRLFLFAWAQIRLTFSLILRLLSFGTTRGLADHNLLLMKVGLEQRARAIFTEVAREAIKKIKLYQDAIENKTLEAQNALIFAGRVALTEGRNAAAVALFKKAKNIRDDEDARVLIGKQLFAANDLDGAMAEYVTALNSATIDSKPSTKSEAHRSVAEVYIRRGNRVLARQELALAQSLDKQHRNYAGLGRTHELIGDLHRPRVDRRNAALTEWGHSESDYAHAGMEPEARRVRRKMAELSGDAGIVDGLWIRALDRCARWLLKIVERRRVRLRMKAA